MSKRKRAAGVFISPEWDKILRSALRESVRLELRQLEALPETAEMGSFSLAFEERMKKVLPMVTRRYSAVGRRTVRRAALVAAILTLILAASAIVIAVTVPQIHYIIFKSNISWDMLFEQEDPNGMAEQEFRPIKPTFPEGYEIIQEDLIPGHYYIAAVDDNDNLITYTQLNSEGSGISIDAEQGDIHKEVINGQTFIVQEAGTVLFDNGYYVFKIDGDCEVSLLIEMGKSVLGQL